MKVGYGAPSHVLAVTNKTVTHNECGEGELYIRDTGRALASSGPTYGGHRNRRPDCPNVFTLLTTNNYDPCSGTHLFRLRRKECCAYAPSDPPTVASADRYGKRKYLSDPYKNINSYTSFGNNKPKY